MESGNSWNGEKSEIDLSPAGNGGIGICLKTALMDYSPSGKIVRLSERGKMRLSCRGEGLVNYKSRRIVYDSKGYGQVATSWRSATSGKSIKGTER
jgi:hypothetical protein